MKMIDLVEKKNPAKVERYVGVRFSKHTTKQLMEFIEKNDIDNPIARKELHCTVAYSEKTINNKVSVLGDIDPPFLGKPTKFAVWKMRGDDHALVMLFNCKKLTDRHEYFIEVGGATYGFDEYLSHVTLSYDIDPEFDVSELKWDGDELEIVNEYTEVLKDN